MKTEEKHCRKSDGFVYLVSEHIISKEVKCPNVTVGWRGYIHPVDEIVVIVDIMDISRISHNLKVPDHLGSVKNGNCSKLNWSGKIRVVDKVCIRNIISWGWNLCWGNFSHCLKVNQLIPFPAINPKLFLIFIQYIPRLVW